MSTMDYFASPNCIDDEYTLFLKYTDEKSVVAAKIHELIYGDLVGKRIIKIWDVGCGNGDLIYNLVNMFPPASKIELHLLEPNAKLLNVAIGKLIKRNVIVHATNKTIEAAIEDIDYDSGQNLIICANMLYYLPDPVMVLKKLYDSLEPGGVICASLHSTASDIYKLRSIFRQYYNEPSDKRLDIEKLAEMIEQLGWNFTTHNISSSLIVPLSELEKLTHAANDPNVLRENVIAGITRFFGHSPTIEIPKDLLRKVLRFYRGRIVNNQQILLKNVGSFVWVRKP
jgi:ubiquinone/menaquinone biosynthesis C-methylase UbiE